MREGRIIPMMAIVEHRLDRRFEFNGLPWNDDYYVRGGAMKRPARFKPSRVRDYKRRDLLNLERLPRRSPWWC